MKTIQVFEAADGTLHRQKSDALDAELWFTLNGCQRGDNKPVMFTEVQVGCLTKNAAKLLPLLYAYADEAGPKSQTFTFVTQPEATPLFGVDLSGRMNMFYTEPKASPPRFTVPSAIIADADELLSRRAWLIGANASDDGSMAKNKRDGNADEIILIEAELKARNLDLN